MYHITQKTGITFLQSRFSLYKYYNLFSNQNNLAGYSPASTKA